MAITYNNDFKDILVALKNKIKAEIKCPVVDDENSMSRNNFFIQLDPQGSEQGDTTKYSEHSTYNILIKLFFMDRKQPKFQNYVLDKCSMLNALIHDNPTLALASGRSAYNLRSGDLDFSLEIEGYEDYVVHSFDFSCEYLSNFG